MADSKTTRASKHTPPDKTMSDKNELLIDKAAKALIDKGFGGPYVLAMVLGTGLGKLTDDLTDVKTLLYSDIPGFPDAKVSGHNGHLVAGKLEGKPVLILQGRSHYYETGQVDAMRIPIGVLARIGSPPLLLTNAAGSARADIRPGSLVLLRDHINFTGLNPLIGESGDERFVPMNAAYDTSLGWRLKQAGQATGIALHDGVYMWFAGPSFETPAEIRMARTLGADIVGMSTVPEVILARRYGLRVGAISVVTNLAAGVEGSRPSHTDTRDTATTASAALRRIVRHFAASLDHA
jgi:purine-nucleoside phosphorylase